METVDIANCSWKNRMRAAMTRIAGSENTATHPNGSANPKPVLILSLQLVECLLLLAQLLRLSSEGEFLVQRRSSFRERPNTKTALSRRGTTESSTDPRLCLSHRYVVDSNK
jgi:hypothetical protein